MMIYGTIAIIGFIIFLNVGLYVLYHDIGSIMIRNFFYSCLMLSLYTLIHFFIITAPDTGVKAEIIKYSYVPMILFSVFILRFSLILTHYYDRPKIKFTFLLLGWITPGILIFKTVMENTIAQDFPLGFWYIFYQALLYIYVSIAILFIFIWWRTTRVDREKKQAKICLIAAVIAVSIAGPLDYLAEFTEQPLLTMIYNLIWICALLYVIIRYRFMVLTPNMVSKDIIDSIDEAVVLFDLNMKILTLNKEGKKILGYYPKRVDEISESIVDSQKIITTFKQFIHDDQKEFSQRIIFNTGEQEITFLLRISKIKDNDNFILGFLSIASEIKGLTFLQKQYNLTSREIQIILNILSGITNLEIAENLDVTERTVKTHITNIYNKLTVNNKIELYLLLQNLNIETDM